VLCAPRAVSDHFTPRWPPVVLAIIPFNYAGLYRMNQRVVQMWVCVDFVQAMWQTSWLTRSLMVIVRTLQAQVRRLKWPLSARPSLLLSERDGRRNKCRRATDNDYICATLEKSDTNRYHKVRQGPIALWPQYLNIIRHLTRTSRNICRNDLLWRENNELLSQ